jgi:hypothetical protein
MNRAHEFFRHVTIVSAGEQMASLIALVCDTHPDRGAEGPFITIVDGLWAFCAAGFVEGEKHRWKPVEPVSVEILRARGVHWSEAPHSATAGK